MNRRIPMLTALILAVSLALAGCGGSGSNGGSDGDTGGGGGEGATTGEGSGEPITIGALLTLSGPVAPIGEEYKKSGEYWASTHQTLLGRPVEVVFADDEGSTTGATEAARRLIQQEDVDFLVGPFISNAVSGVLPIATENEVIESVLSAYPPAGDASTYPYSFQTEYTKAIEAPAQLQEFEQLGYQRLGLLVTDNALGEETTNSMRQTIEEMGSPVEIVAVGRYASGSTDITAQARKLLEANVDVVSMAAVGPSDYINAITSLDQVGYEGPIFGNSAVALPSVAEGLKPELAQQVRASGFTDSTLRGTLTEATKEFRQGLTDFLGVEELSIPLYQTSSSWDGFQLIYSAVKGAGTLDPQKIKTYLEENGYDGLKADYKFTTENHQGLSVEDMAFGVTGTFENGALLNLRCKADSGSCDLE